jgi:hypothetical protein
MAAPLTTTSAGQIQPHETGSSDAKPTLQESFNHFNSPFTKVALTPVSCCSKLETDIIRHAMVTISQARFRARCLDSSRLRISHPTTA